MYKNYIHRILKPENILIKYTDNNNINFELIDFGFSTSYKFFNRNYRAPETETLHYNNKCDLWMLGIILYELSTNKYIFCFNLKKTENYRQKGKIINKTDNELINNLINKLIRVDIEKRIIWKEYFDDDFFKKNDNNENQQIIKIKINIDEDNEKITIYNGNEDIDEKNIKWFIDNKEIKFNKEIIDDKIINYYINN